MTTLPFEAAGPQRTLASCAIGERFRGVFLLNRAEMKKARNGKDFIRAEIGDPSGNLAGNLFDARSEDFRAIQGAAAVEAVGVVQEYNGSRSALFDELRPSKADPKALLPRSPKAPEKLYTRLRGILGLIQHPDLKRLVFTFLDDAELRKRIMEVPAATVNHHAYIGGLLEHIVSLSESVIKTCEAYPHLNRDLMLAGAFLHDIGKVFEISTEKGFDYTTEGKLHGHILIGLRMIERKANTCGGETENGEFPPKVLEMLEHIVASHHGKLEWGSPVLPATPEALALHALDNLDAQLWECERAAADPVADGKEWTEWVKPLGRRLYKGPQA